MSRSKRTDPPAIRATRRLAAEPRVVVRRPQPGFHHPATKSDVLETLRSIGPLALYGVRVVELARRTETHPTSIAFGSYRVPGTILLYEQPLPPWRLPGAIPSATAQRLEKAGARLTTVSGATLVEWPAGTLCRFMLDEVLLHEIGHHILQYHTGKRPVRIARTRDHEAFAANFADKQRDALRKRSGTPQ